MREATRHERLDLYVHRGWLRCKTYFHYVTLVSAFSLKSRAPVLKDDLSNPAPLGEEKTRESFSVFTSPLVLVWNASNNYSSVQFFGHPFKRTVTLARFRLCFFFSKIIKIERIDFDKLKND